MLEFLQSLSDVICYNEVNIQDYIRMFTGRFVNSTRLSSAFPPPYIDTLHHGGFSRPVGMRRATCRAPAFLGPKSFILKRDALEYIEYLEVRLRAYYNVEIIRISCLLSPARNLL